MFLSLSCTCFTLLKNYKIPIFNAAMAIKTIADYIFIYIIYIYIYILNKGSPVDPLKFC